MRSGPVGWLQWKRQDMALARRERSYLTPDHQRLLWFALGLVIAVVIVATRLAGLDDATKPRLVPAGAAPNSATAPTAPPDRPAETPSTELLGPSVEPTTDESPITEAPELVVGPTATAVVGSPTSAPQPPVGRQVAPPPTNAPPVSTGGNASGGGNGSGSSQGGGAGNTNASGGNGNAGGGRDAAPGATAPGATAPGPGGSAKNK